MLDVPVQANLIRTSLGTAVTTGGPLTQKSPHRDHGSSTTISPKKVHYHGGQTASVRVLRSKFSPHKKATRGIYLRLKTAAVKRVSQKEGPASQLRPTSVT